MRTRGLVVCSTMLLVVSCKKSDPAAAGAASGEAVQAATVPSLSDFEGDITIVSKSAKEKRPIPPITLTVKGNKMRFDLPEGMEGAPKMGERAYAIADTTTKKLDVVVDAQKMVMEMDLATMGDQIRKMTPHSSASATEAKTPPKVTKTGHNDTVAGMTCEDWDVTSDKGNRGRVCVASTSTSWLSIPNLGLPSEQTWAKELFDGQHLPLRMISYDAAGTEESRLEVTKLEKKPVLDSTFTIPAGYRTMDFTQMMAGIQGMLGGLGGPNHGSGMPGFPSALPPGMTLPPGMASSMAQNAAHMQVSAAQLQQNAAQLQQNAAQMLKELQERAKAAGAKPPAQAPH
ncbi:MAG TPA: DUF4412 domain-containing protein [Polyangiaceae bacterium]|nr:DUF4412 domain-containing protein [Polyangiaceae bacterium]